jgi:hypothetical protein
MSWRPAAARLPAAPTPTLPSPTTAMLNRRFCAPDAIDMASLIEATKESQMSRDPRQAEAPARADGDLPTQCVAKAMIDSQPTNHPISFAPRRCRYTAHRKCRRRLASLVRN